MKSFDRFTATALTIQSLAVDVKAEMSVVIPYILVNSGMFNEMHCSKVKEIVKLILDYFFN